MTGSQAIGPSALIAFESVTVWVHWVTVLVTVNSCLMIITLKWLNICKQMIGLIFKLTLCVRLLSVYKRLQSFFLINAFI